MSKEFWTQTGVMASLFLGLAGLMLALHSDLRADMRDLRADMRADHVDIGSEMRDGFASIRSQIERLDGRLDGLDRRTARIEGHLFGVELPDPSEPALDNE